MKVYFLFAFLFLSLTGQAQEYTKERLELMEDEELLEFFNKVGDDSIKAEVVARIYLNRGKKQGDTIKMARGYDRLARIFHPKKNIRFADSVIELTKNIKHKTYPALGYMLKSHQFDELNDLKASVENALLCYDFALTSKNVPQQLYISDYLIFTKAIWGNGKDALNLQKKRNKLINRIDFEESIRQSTRVGALKHIDDLILEAKLSSIQNFVFCYLKQGKLDSAGYHLKRGIEKSNTYKGYTSKKKYYSNWFLEISIELYFLEGEYLDAISTSDELLLTNINELSESSLLNIFLMKGLSHKANKNNDIGLNYLRMADSIYDNFEVSILPNQRILFEQLLVHYVDKKDVIKQIKYLNKLIDTDSLFKRNYQFFEPDMIKNFETPKLLIEKELLISELKKKNNKSRNLTWSVIGALSLSFLVIGYYFNRQLLYKKRFDDLLADNTGKNLINKSYSTELSTKVIDDIMEHLKCFEFEKGYLSNKISLQDLATSFKTNSRYLSKVINLQKDKHFPTYINDLRVDFALKELSENAKFRKYTIKAIAQDCGFNGSEPFSKAFCKRHGVSASYYIKKIETLKS